MILTTTVHVKWGKHNKDYYEKVGYQFTRYGESFDVKVEDVIKGNHTAKVTIRCDKCGKERQTYLFCLYDRANEGHLCKKCSDRNGHKNSYYNQSKRPRSFYDACCKKIGADQFEVYWSSKNRDSASEIIKYSNKKVWMRCQKVPYHEDYLISCCEFLRGKRCSQCGNFKVHPNDSVGAEMDAKYGDGYALTRWGEENEVSPYAITFRSKVRIWLKCPDNIHSDYCQQAATATNATYRCPRCVRDSRKSYLQEKVELYIQHKYGYEMLFEYKCHLRPKNPKTKMLLPIDIEIPKIKLAIEVDGMQHYKKSAFGYLNKGINEKMLDVAFANLKERDKVKKEYILSHDYSYLEIPYWTEKDESYKTLIDDAIALALSKQSEVAI